MPGREIQTKRTCAAMKFNTFLGILAILFWSTNVAFSRSLIEQMGLLTSGAAIFLLGGGLSLAVVARRARGLGFPQTLFKKIFVRLRAGICDQYRGAAGGDRPFGQPHPDDHRRTDQLPVASLKPVVFDIYPGEKGALVSAGGSGHFIGGNVAGVYQRRGSEYSARCCSRPLWASTRLPYWRR